MLLFPYSLAVLDSLSLLFQIYSFSFSSIFVSGVDESHALRMLLNYEECSEEIVKVQLQDLNPVEAQEALPMPPFLCLTSGILGESWCTLISNDIKENYIQMKKSRF